MPVWLKRILSLTLDVSRETWGPKYSRRLWEFEYLVMMVFKDKQRNHTGNLFAPKD